MGKIFVVMGKTSSGKNLIYKRMLDNLTLNQGVCKSIKTVVRYTTRPMHPGETNGVEYFFATEEELLVRPNCKEVCRRFLADEEDIATHLNKSTEIPQDAALSERGQTHG